MQSTVQTHDHDNRPAFHGQTSQHPVTWRALGGGLGGLHVVSVHGLGALLFLLGGGRPGLDHRVHVLHELQLLAPQVLLPDELPARPLVLFLLTFLLRLPPKKPSGSSLFGTTENRRGSVMGKGGAVLFQQRGGVVL